MPVWECYSQTGLSFNMKGFIIILILFPLAAYAQKHDNFQLYGYGNNSPVPALFGGMVVDYSFQPPKFYPQKRKVDISFYSGIGSDSSGHLMFYTNGISIRDTTHNVMLNGDTLNAGTLWLQWKDKYFPNGPFCFSLPSPGKKNEYTFFHVSGEAFSYNSAPFYYTQIDMKGNNGLGKVTKKNQILLPEGKSYIVPVAVKHGNGRDWWVIIGELSSPYLYTFLLDPTGVNGPFKTEMPYWYSAQEYQSVNAISPDGNTYVRSDGEHGLYIFDFDRCGGAFSNLRLLPFNEPDFFSFATVFAPDSRHLYMSSWSFVTQLDISAPDIAASLDTIAYFDGKASPNEPFLTGFFNPNLGPDGKIYYSTTNGTLSWHVIHSPDLPGVAADIEQHGIDLTKYNDGTMAIYPNYRLGEWEGAPCDTLNGQKPGDGFSKTSWFPPAESKIGQYKLLPGIGQAREKDDTPRKRHPTMAEMAIERAAQAPILNSKN